MWDKYFYNISLSDKDFTHFSGPLNRAGRQKARLGDRAIDWIPTILSKLYIFQGLQVLHQVSVDLPPSRARRVAPIGCLMFQGGSVVGKCTQGTYLISHFTIWEFLLI